MMNKRDDDDYDPFVLRVRGLPWSASKEDIIKFFEGCNLKNGGAGIHLTMSREGRPSGEAYVEFETEDDASKGLGKNNEHLGNRYIEVFRSKPNEMEWALRKCGLDGEEPFGDACVRLRGLPFGCSKEEIAQFFTGLEIVRNGITLPTDFQGRSTGEAYVQFSSQEIAEKAMGKHKEKIGHRYIEIFKSSQQEIRNAMGMGPMRMRGMGASRPGPYDRGERSFGRGRGSRGGAPTPSGLTGRTGFNNVEEQVRDTGHNVHLRGLPFRAVERDIFEFFAPLKPVAVRIKYRSTGRSTGEADAMFATHDDAVRAMKKDKEKIQHRYIELFLRSEPEVFRRDVPYGGPSGGPAMFNRNRSFMSEPEEVFGGPPMTQDRYNSPGMSDRGFGTGSGRNFVGSGSDRGFDSSFSGAANSPNAGGLARGFGGGDREFGYRADKPFPTAGNDRGSGFGADRGFNDGSMDRGFNRNVTDRSFGASAVPDRAYGAGRPFSGGDRFAGGESGMDAGFSNYRNGSMPGNRNDNFGKLFGGNNYQSSGNQNMNMMGPTTYPGY